MSGFERASQPSGSPASQAASGEASAGKQTLVPQAPTGEAPAGEAHGSAPAPRAAGKPPRPMTELFGARPTAPAANPGPGPRSNLGGKAAAIMRAKTPRQLQRVVPASTLQQHGVPVRTEAANPVQRKGDGAANPHMLETAAQGTSGAGGQLPHLAAIQRSFGRHDVSGVQAHTDGPASKATQALGAEAYATGNHVAFGGAPSLHTAAHEAAHVVQQRGGVQLRGGVGQAGDAHEQHADQVADKVVRGESSEVLLDKMSGGGGAAVQRQVQFDLRGTVGEQRDARGVDTPQGGAGGQHGSFSDQAADDHGPEFHHDHGFLDDGHGGRDESRLRDPTWADRVELLKWVAKLEAAELLRPDLVDGTAAYRHFLNGNGATRDIQYARFLANDSSGHTVLASAMADTRQAALERHDRDVAASGPTEGTSSYHIRTGVMSVTSGDARYPYPATENWQKAIGAHSLYIEATVTVTVTRVHEAGGGLPGGVPAAGEGSSSDVGPPTYARHFHVEMTIHAEDMYNFNPGNFDIATGLPDDANGRFELTGLGHEYLNTGTYSQPFDFDSTMEPAASPANNASPSDAGRGTREGRPADRRGYPTAR